jgi:superfamily II DNA or RNA helicase
MSCAELYSPELNLMTDVTAARFETGQGVRWRGCRWQVLQEERNGLLTLVGVDDANRDQEVTPLVALEGDELAADELPLPQLDVTTSDRAMWRAMHRSFEVTMAGGREQLVGLDWAAVAVEPFQLVPLLRVARSIRPRLLLADDVGLGKTTQAALVLRWLAQRHLAGRVLIVTKASPEPERWQSELRRRFGFSFDILRNGADFNRRRRAAPTVNVFAQEQRLIISMTLAARQMFLDELRQCPTPYDVVIVDEAHYLAERGSSTKRLVVLGRELARLSRDGTMLLLTATPHDGRTDSFLSLLRLLDPMVESQPGEVPVDLASRLMVRRMKSEVTFAGGQPFRIPRTNVVSTLADATRQEQALAEPLDAYLAWLAAEEARYDRAGARQKAKGCQFLASVYRKRFGSSVAALRATLRRRLQLPKDDEDGDGPVPFMDTDGPDPEDELVDPGAAAEAPPPPVSDEELCLAAELLDAATAVPRGEDSKLRALSKLLARPDLSDEKVVVFTEYRDTLRAASSRLSREGITHVLFHGDTSDRDRKAALHSFTNDPSIRVFLATDAASEGINLQRAACHLVSLDVPWNPNRYAQRAGRIARYGQTRTPHIWSFVAADRKADRGRPEARALEIVVEKLALIERQQGSISRFLPRSDSLQRLLAGAQRSIDEDVERLLDDEAAEIAERDYSRLTLHNRQEKERAERYVAELGVVDDFAPMLDALLRTVFAAWDDGGEIVQSGSDEMRITVPGRLRTALGVAWIERATYRRAVAVAATADEFAEQPVDFLTPSHPLVEAILRELRCDAADPAFRHRFDVEVGAPERMVCSFAVRFVDGDGRTVDECLLAVPVDARLQPDVSADDNLDALGLDQAPAAGVPDSATIRAWVERWQSVAAAATAAAELRAERRRLRLVAAAETLREQELEVLALWRSDQARALERLVFGSATAITLEQGETLDVERRRLDAEYEARKASLRDRTAIRLAQLELIGGRLYVRGEQ